MQVYDNDCLGVFSFSYKGKHISCRCEGYAAVVVNDIVIGDWHGGLEHSNHDKIRLKN